MTLAVVLAGAAGVAAVLAVWDGLRAAEAAALRGGLAAVLAPWRLAGERGRAASGEERGRLAVLAALTAGACGLLLAGPAAGLLVAVCVPLVVGRVLTHRRERWSARVAEGAPAVARGLADALSGGHSVRGALGEVAAAGGTGPACDAELRTIAAQLAVGEPTDVALDAFRERVRAPVYDVLVATILLQQRTGGDLARTLRDLAGDLEDVRRSTHDARTATAQARFTAQVVAGLPVGVALLAEVVSPGALGSLLGSGISRVLVVFAVTLDVVALVAVRRIARVAW
jgi:tight adherence protein B